MSFQTSSFLACLGIYQEKEVHIKNGKYGYYAEWGENKESLKNIKIPIKNITIESFIEYLESKETKIVSLGHRNAQGLYYSKKYDFIISTEHGPKGGDEININHKPAKKIKNFGWPISSYGEHYYKNHPDKILKEAPLNKSHKKFGFEEPIKYFVPSIGISEIVSLNENDSEFLVGAMGNEIVEQDLGLHFIKLNKKRDKVIDHNYISLNERVRDMIITNDKKKIIIFLESSSSLLILER